MIGHWCGKSVRGFSVALSASALVACASHSYELGKKDAGTGGGGGTTGSSGKAGKAGTGAEGGDSGNGAGGSSAAANAQGGSSAAANAQGGSSIDTGGSQNVGGTGAGGSGPAGAGTGGSIALGNPLVQQIGTAPTKLDLLFMIDNSISMAEKQTLLATAMPSLLARFVSCRDGDGNRVGSFAPDSCAPGTWAEFGGLDDIHIGIITSSIGDHGSDDVCSDTQNANNVAMGIGPSNYNDLAQLLPSVRDDDFEGADAGFLFWAPGDADEHHTDPEVLASDAQAQLTAAGERGCGYEAQLESWYRFLVDPSPVTSIGRTSDGSQATVRGAINNVVLEQRAAFLRPDSVLAIVMLSDENDCSIVDEDGTQGWLVGYKGGLEPGAQLWHMPRATSGCATAPNDPSQCRPCNVEDDADPECAKGNSLPLLDDSMNMRCFHQAQRFGIDLLYPVERYSRAITQATIVPRFGGPEVPNPLFAPGPDGTPGRAAGQVVLAGLVGVPWQDVSTPESWATNSTELTFLSADDLAAQARWDIILGDPAAGVGPTDPHMIESIDPRPTGAAHPLIPNIAIGSPNETTNVDPINGHEQVTLSIRDDLQFACIFPLAEPVPCTDANADSCDCNFDDAARNSPLCEGTTASKDGTQVDGKAYPGIRELEVLKGVGSSAVVASACPKNPESNDASDQNAGYVPALNALADRLVQSFADPCLPHSLPISQCVVIEARPVDGSDCDITGRQVPEGNASDLGQKIEYQMRTQGYDRTAFTLCQVAALEGDELDACENTAGGGSGAGYCYLDADNGIGDPNLLGSCPASMKHRIRFVGDALPASGALTYISCTDGR